MKKLGSRYLIAAVLGTVVICAGICLSFRWLSLQRSEATTPDGLLKTNSPKEGKKDPKHRPAKAEGVVMKATLKLGSKALPVVFEDGDHTEELRQVIIADMNLIFGHLEDYRFLKLHKPTWFVIGGRKVKAIEHIHFNEPGRMWPDDYDGERSHRIVTLDGKPHLVVSRELLKVYGQALEFKKKNAKIFTQLEEFIAKFKRDGLPRLTADEIDDYFWFDKGALSKRKRWRENPDQFVNQPNNWRFRRPSLLNIKTGSELWPGEDDLDFLVALMYVLDDNGIPDGEMGLVYHKGRWKFPVVDYGT